MTGERQTELEELEFEIVTERWNRYRLDDGALIRARAIALKVFKPKGKEVECISSGDMQTAMQNFVVVSPPDRLKGAPNPEPPSPDEALKSMNPEERRILESEEDWNIYRIRGESVGFKVKIVVIGISRIPNKWDQRGDPFYVVSSTNAFGPASNADLGMNQAQH